MQLKFLVTGCHGDIAFSVAKIIKKNFKRSRIIGTDIHLNGSGNFIFDKVFTVPKVKNLKYLKEILKLSKSVDLIIPSTDQEILFFSKNRKYFKNKILINDHKIIHLLSNKIKIQKFLRKNFFDCSLDISRKLSDYKNYNKIPLPFFLKKISGSGNQNYKIFKNKTDLKDLKFYKKNDWVIEELLNMNTIEYTSAIIRLKNIKKVIILERRLHILGHTMYAKTYHNLKLENKLLEIANKLNLNGSINIQFKVIKNQIKIFDINPRLSSTIMMRDLIGFKDCLWWIKDVLNFKNNLLIKIKKNKTLIKYFEEDII